jgi:hypothetical protein
MIRFAIDYTFWLNIAFGIVAATLLWLHVRSSRNGAGSAMAGG